MKYFGERRCAATPWVSRGLRIGVFCLAICAMEHDAWAFRVVGPPTAVFSGDAAAAVLTGLTLTVFRSRDSGPPGTSLPIQVQLVTAQGVPDGPPVATTLPASGVLSVPIGDGSLGHGVVIEGAGEPNSAPVYWYSGLWSWTTMPIVMQCTGCQILRGHWSIVGNPVIAASDSVVGPRSLAVVDSGFDVVGVRDGVDTDSLFVTGDASFITLSDGTRIAFPNGSKFGEIADISIFSFALGVVATGNIPGPVTSIGTTPFSAPSVTATQTPVAAPALPWLYVVALAVALLTLGAFARRSLRSAGPPHSA